MLILILFGIKFQKKLIFFLSVDTKNLISDCALQIHYLRFEKPKINKKRVGLDFTDKNVESLLIGEELVNSIQDKHSVDCIELIKNETKLTRETVVAIIENANNTEAFLKNPEK